ncbi:hypothetical protein [Crenothrix sp.]|uniref:hypothetical protein n=1 Tax=Crenothrix sp. TaxID=3100433 RepID=UPI00374D5397
MKIKLNDSFTKYRLIAPFLYLMLVVHNGYAADEQAKISESGKKAAPLLVTLSSQKVQIGNDGKEIFSNADKVKPGDLVQYTAVYRNRGNSSITGLNASLPIPFGMGYVEKSARPASALATADGTKFEAEPLMQTIKDKDGNEKQVAVPYSGYQSLRWEIGELEAGKKFEVSARMRVNSLSKSPAELVVKKSAVPAATAWKPY